MCKQSDSLDDKQTIFCLQWIQPWAVHSLFGPSSTLCIHGKRSFDTANNFCLPVVLSVSVLGSYLDGGRLTSWISHKALKWILKILDSTRLTAKLASCRPWGSVLTLSTILSFHISLLTPHCIWKTLEKIKRWSLTIFQYSSSSSSPHPTNFTVLKKERQYALLWLIVQRKRDWASRTVLNSHWIRSHVGWSPSNCTWPNIRAGEGFILAISIICYIKTNRAFIAAKVDFVRKPL